MYFLGIDGGGTKTEFILADEKGNILGSSTVGPTYLRSVTFDVLCKTLAEGATLAIQNAKLDPLKVKISKTL